MPTIPNRRSVVPRPPFDSNQLPRAMRIFPRSQRQVTPPLGFAIVDQVVQDVWDRPSGNLLNIKFKEQDISDPLVAVRKQHRVKMVLDFSAKPILTRGATNIFHAFVGEITQKPAF